MDIRKSVRNCIEMLRGIYRRLTAGGSTEERAIQSGIWAAGINVGDRILQLLKIIILARLLSPEAFGLLGIALLVLSMLRRFSQLGFDEALIQHRNKNINAYLNTAWVMKISRGILIATLMFASAPYLASFFNEPRAEPLIQVLGVANLFLSVQNPGIVYFRKDLKFHTEFIYLISARMIDLVVAVSIALIFHNVWALAAGIVAMNITQFVLSFVLHNYRPNLEFNLQYGKEMFSFGKWMTAQAILVFLIYDADDAFVGWFFSATTLGFYQLAYRYSNAPATEVTQVISRVAFPTFSKVQDDVRKLREGLFRVIHLSTLIAFPMAAGIVAVAPMFVNVVFGSQWEPMVPLIQVLAVWGGVRAFSHSPGEVFKAIGRPDYDVWLLTLKTAIIAIAIYPAAEYFGVLGVAYVILGQSVIIEPIRTYLILSVIDGKITELLTIVIYPLIGSLGMYGIVTSVDNYVISGVGFVELCIIIVTGMISYIVLMSTIETQTEYEFTAVYRTIRRAI